MTAPGRELPDGTQLGPVTLRLADLERGARFYRDVLGLRPRGEGDGWAEFGTPARTLVRLERTAAPRPAATAPGLYHVALLLPDRAALGAWLRHAVDAGTPLQGAADHAVSEAIYLSDPEGNGLEVYRDRPRREWREAGGEVQMGTDPLDARGLLASAAGRAWVGAPEGTRVGHVHLQVAELEVAGRFYTETVGFALRNAAYPSARFLAAGGYHHHLGLNRWNVDPRATPASDAPGLAAMTLELPDASARDALAARLESATGVGEPYRDPIGVRLALALTPP